MNVDKFRGWFLKSYFSWNVSRSYRKTGNQLTDPHSMKYNNSLVGASFWIQGLCIFVLTHTVFFILKMTHIQSNVQYLYSMNKWNAVSFVLIHPVHTCGMSLSITLTVPYLTHGGPCTMLYEGHLKSSWTGGSAPLLCRRRHNSITMAHCCKSTNFSNCPCSCSTILKKVLLK
jgi:hypothetical protein